MPKRTIADLEEIPLGNGYKYAKTATESPLKERTGYGRKIDVNNGVVEIYKDEIAGIKVYQCPFCDIKPLASDIRFRKHLKLHHPTKKTLLKDAPRPPELFTEEIPFEALYPKAILPKSSPMPGVKDKIESKLIKTELNGSLIFNQNVDQKELLLSQEDQSLMQAKFSHDVTENEVVSVALQEVRDVSNSPMLVISQDALVSQQRQEMGSRVIQLAEYNPITEEQGIASCTGVGNNTNTDGSDDKAFYREFDSEDVDLKLASKSSRGRPLSANSLKLQKFMDSSVMLLGDVLDDSENLTGLDLRCGVCGVVLEEDKLDTYCDLTKELEPNQTIQQGEPLSKILESIIGPVPAKLLCSLCEGVTADVARTRSSIRKLQKRLTDAVGRLMDLSMLGKRLLEEDLAEGGITDTHGELESRVSLKVVEESRVHPGLPDAGLTVLNHYVGKVLMEGEEGVDDGSSPTEMGCQELQKAMYITQQEWASGGLVVSNEVVQVPHDLVGGIGVGSKGARVVISKALSQDLFFTHFCLDCDKGFNNIGQLVDHCETHADNYQAEAKTGIDCSDDSFNQIEDFDYENVLKVKGTGFAEQARIKDLNQSDKYRIELRSYMHKEQFKDCIDEVPTLEKPFQCKECNKTFERAHDLWGHHASFRGPAFKCNFQSCEEVFLRLPDFAVHYSGHAGIDLVIPESSAEKKALHITCPVCSTVVPGLYKLQRHKMKHDPELKYKCPACPKQFVKANTLRMHISNVHKGSKPQKKCKLCDAVLFSESGLYAHMKTAHNSEDRFSCELCGEIFLSESQLNEHSLSHTDPLHWSHVCEKCKKPFFKKSLLVAHLQLASRNGGVCPEDLQETDQRKLIKKVKKPDRNICTECDVLLDENTSLQQHYRIAHPSMEQRFQCSECDLGETGKFLSLTGARKHYRLVHKNRPHTCWVCKDTYTRDIALHVHISNVHPDVVGVPAAQGEIVQCLHCHAVFGDHMERVAHTRYNHMVETIDITSTDLDEVTMVGGHVIEFGANSDQIIALHTIP